MNRKKRKIRPVMDRFMEKIRKTEGCWIWTGQVLPRRAYGRFYYDGKTRYAHRVALMLLKGLPIDTEGDTLHSCDNPSCVNPDHLKYGTHQENMIDALEKGRTIKPGHWNGSSNPHAKLSDEQRNRLIGLIQSGANPTKTARDFNVSGAYGRQLARKVRQKSEQRELQ